MRLLDWQEIENMIVSRNQLVSFYFTILAFHKLCFWSNLTFGGAVPTRVLLKHENHWVTSTWLDFSAVFVIVSVFTASHDYGGAYYLDDMLVSPLLRENPHELVKFSKAWSELWGHRSLTVPWRPPTGVVQLDDSSTLIELCDLVTA